MIDSWASICFIDEDFIKLYKILLVTMPYPFLIEVIDDQFLAFRHVTHETIPLEIELEGHNNFLVFHVIKISVISVILGLSWLRKYNPYTDWCGLKIKSFPCKVQWTQPIKSNSQHPKSMLD